MICERAEQPSAFTRLAGRAWLYTNHNISTHQTATLDFDEKLAKLTCCGNDILVCPVANVFDAEFDARRGCIMAAITLADS
jgi:hypothetical protein